jgi:pimeloyl-ACP methyl ester carboxylesterase
MEKKFQYQQADIFYTVEGSGNTVVLIHGFGEDDKIWHDQAIFLKEHCQLIIPALPGSGKSGLLQKRPVTIEDYAECIKALLDDEGVEKCILLGHSMGGYITLAFAQNYAEYLLGFGLVHSTAFADSEEKKTTRLKGIKMLEEYSAYSFIKNTTPNLFSAEFKKLQSEKVSALIKEGKNFSKEALIQYYNAMMNRLDRTEVLKNAKVPVLFVIGSEDTAAPLADLLNQVHLPKVSHLHIINGVGHISLMEAPEQLNNYLLEFIESLE